MTILKQHIRLAIIGIVVLIIMAVLLLCKEREKMRRLGCSSNLRSIGCAIQLYAADNNNNFPPYDGAKGLVMLDYIVVNPILFISPIDNRMPAASTSTMNEDNLSYVYFGGMDNSIPIGTPIAFLKPNLGSSVTCVLFHEAEPLKSVICYPTNFPSCILIIEFLDKEGKVPPSLRDLLMEKARHYDGAERE